MKKRSGKSAKAKVRVRVPSRRASKAPRTSVNAVFLVGFMGAGKTSVGLALGQRLNWIFEDLDDRVELRERRSVAEIFRDSGEQHFREAEHEALRAMLTEADSSPRVVALGGGAFVQQSNANLLKAFRAPTVFLDAGVDELWQRCSKQAEGAGVERPLLRSLEQFRKLYAGRRPSYAKASVQVQTGGRSVDEITSEIIKKLRLNAIAIRIEEGETE